MPSRNFVAFDPLTILSRLRDVEYLVVGGFAALLYGAPTSTGDLDILPADNEENVVRLANVLATLDAVVREPRLTGSGQDRCMLPLRARVGAPAQAQIENLLQ